MPSTRYLMVRSAKGASRTTHDGCAAPSLRPEANSFTCSQAGGRNRHIITDTAGHLVAAQVHAADIQDRDGAPGLLASIRYLFPWLRHVFADGGSAGDKLTTALAQHGDWRIEIVKRSDQVTGFRLLPRRWVVERTFAWLNRNRRLAKDFEATIGSSEGANARHNLSDS